MKLTKLNRKHQKTKWGRLRRRHLRVRKKIEGTATVPRLMVRKTNRHIHLLIINDNHGGSSLTLKTLSTSRKGQDPKKNYRNVENAKKVGAEAAAALKELGISKAVFDRGGFAYHGTVKALADAIREGGVTI